MSQKGTTSVFSQDGYDRIVEGWPGEDIHPVVLRYEEALADFHRSFPAKDPIPLERAGKPHAANHVWLDSGAVEEDWNALQDAHDGNYYRASIETMIFCGFMEAAEVVVSRTFEVFSAWTWKDSTDHLREEEIHGFWEVLMQDLEREVEGRVGTAYVEEEAKAGKAESS